MSCARPESFHGDHDGLAQQDIADVARRLSGIDRIRRGIFTSYPGMDHVAVTILLHIFMEQDGQDWAPVAAIPESLDMRVATVQRYLEFLNSTGIIEGEKNAGGHIAWARLTGGATDVLPRYLRAIAGLLSPHYEDHQ
jgi:hypothetical protein